MAAIYEGTLAVWPVSRTGAPFGPPRRVTTESAHSPSWQGDSRHILYQSLDTLRILDIETGETRTVPLDLSWTPAIPTGRVDHPCRPSSRHDQPDGTHQRRRHDRRQPHRPRRPACRRATTPAAQVVDAVAPDGDAGADRIPLAPAEGLRRRAGARLAGVRRHDRQKPGQHALRSRRGSRGQRGRRASRPTGVRHRLPDGMGPRVLQDGHRHLECRASSRWNCSGQGSSSTT